jgi:hypothetical protein
MTRRFPCLAGAAAGFAAAALALLAAGCGGDGGAAAPEADAAAALEARALAEGAAARIVPEEIRVGDPAELTVLVRHGEGERVAMPDIRDGKAVMLRETPAGEETAAADGTPLWKWTGKVTSLAVGSHVVGEGAEIELVGADGTNRVAFPFAAFEVKSSLAGEDDSTLRAADGRLLAWKKGRNRFWWIFAAIVVAMLALAVAARRFFRRGGETPEAAPPPIPAHEAALAALAALRAKGWMESRAFEPFYTELSRIVRRYLEDRFGLRAPERTTEEFMREAVKSPALTAAQRDSVGSFLEQSDLVKFARHEPAPEDMSSGLAAAERLVRETAPRENPPADAAAAGSSPV